MQDTDIRSQRANRSFLNGQQVVRMLYDSIKGTSTEEGIFDLKKFFNLHMHDNDLRRFDRDWDFALDELASRGIQYDQETPRSLYMTQVRVHPLLQQHMANWTLLDDATSRTYKWLRTVVKRVLDEEHVKRNNSVWQVSKHVLPYGNTSASHQHYVASVENVKFQKGMCHNWYRQGRCSTPNCGFTHEGPDVSQRQPQSSQRRKASAHSSARSNVRSTSVTSQRSYHSSRSGSVSDQSDTAFKKTMSVLLKGACRRGSQCSYPHPEVCLRWMKGVCRNGSTCARLHQTIPTPPADAALAPPKALQPDPKSAGQPSRTAAKPTNKKSTGISPISIFCRFNPTLQGLSVLLVAEN